MPNFCKLPRYSCNISAHHSWGMLVTISSQLLFFFSALGAFNGLLLTAYLLLSKPVSIERRLLALLILVISLRISKSIWFYFDPDVGKQFLQLGLSACFFIGPLLYFYIASAQGQLAILRVNWTWHLGLLIAITVGIGIIFPYESNQELWGVFYRVINWTWALYILGAASLIMPKVLVRIRERRSLSATEKLALSVFSGTTLIWLAYFTASYTSYIVGALSFTFVLYLSVLLWVIAKNNKAENREKANPSYLANKIDQTKAAELQSKINALMEQEQLYKNANLTLPQLAKRLHISVPLLSQFLNDNMQKSFATFINEWRIFEAKKLLIEAPRMTMEVVAEESGYNSQSTFYAAFKKIEKLTPAKYRQHELNAANVSPKL